MFFLCKSGFFCNFRLLIQQLEFGGLHIGCFDLNLLCGLIPQKLDICKSCCGHFCVLHQFKIILLLSESGLLSSLGIQCLHLECIRFHLGRVLSGDLGLSLSSKLLRLLSLALYLSELLCGQSGELFHLPIVLFLRFFGFFCILGMKSLHFLLHGFQVRSLLGGELRCS